MHQNQHHSLFMDINMCSKSKELVVTSREGERKNTHFVRMWQRYCHGFPKSHFIFPQAFSKTTVSQILCC